jgi:clan AA aspartic protease
LSAFVVLTPSLRVVLRNPLLGKKYPEEGQVVAVIDTGYEGFIAIPRDIFDSLQFNKLRLEKMRLLLANGETLASEGAYGAFSVLDLALSAEGFVETYEGLVEVLLGVEALERTRTLLDYCKGRVKVDACS